MWVRVPRTWVNTCNFIISRNKNSLGTRRKRINWPKISRLAPWRAINTNRLTKVQALCLLMTYLPHRYPHLTHNSITVLLIRQGKLQGKRSQTTSIRSLSMTNLQRVSFILSNRWILLILCPLMTIDSCALTKNFNSQMRKWVHSCTTYSEYNKYLTALWLI